MIQSHEFAVNGIATCVSVLNNQIIFRDTPEFDELVENYILTRHILIQSDTPYK